MAVHARFVPSILLAAASVVSPLSATPPPGPATPAVADLQAYAPGALAAWGVPGAVLVLVKDGRVALLQGVGVKEAGRPEPVGPHTLFALASLTKGFTAAAAGVLAEDGKLKWDEPLAAVLPGFAVADPVVTRELTVHDALAHRSGLSELVDVTPFYFGADRAEVLRRLAHVPQGAPFRDGFTYVNALYVALGEGLGRRAGMLYEDLVRQRILAPLGMHDARFGFAAMKAAPDRARPHVDTDGTARAVEPDDVDAILPAAGLYASGADMARWLLALLGDGALGPGALGPGALGPGALGPGALGDGALEGRRAFGAETAARLRAPQNLVPFAHIVKDQFPSTHFLAYGYGWMLQDYRGALVAWNTGGLRGMTCSIAFVPERGFGVAVLTNGPRTSLPEALVWRAVDAELGIGPGAPARDWSGERLARSLARRAAAKQKEAERYAVPAGAAPPALRGAACAGRYDQPAVGTVEVAASNDGGMSIRLGRGIAGRLAPWNGDTYLASWVPADHGFSLVRFVAGPDGRAAAIEVEELGTFTRVP